MNKIHLLLPFFLVLALWQSGAHAAIYKSVDNYGNVTYSNMPIKGAFKLDIAGAGPSAAEKTQRSNPIKTPTPVNFPRVDSQTQDRRDNTRKAILASELENEQKALLEAKKAYADGMATSAPSGKIDPSMRPDDKLQRLQADVDSHENNVQLLQKELRYAK